MVWLWTLVMMGEEVNLRFQVEGLAADRRPTSKPASSSCRLPEIGIEH